LNIQDTKDRSVQFSPVSSADNPTFIDNRISKQTCNIQFIFQLKQIIPSQHTEFCVSHTFTLSFFFPRFQPQRLYSGSKIKYAGDKYTRARKA